MKRNTDIIKAAMGLAGIKGYHVPALARAIGEDDVSPKVLLDEGIEETAQEIELEAQGEASL